MVAVSNGEWALKGFVLMFLYVFAFFYPGWSTQSGFLLDDLELKYGLFYVCGFKSTSRMHFDSDCYVYGSDKVPVQFERITNWDMLQACGHCPERRKAAGAMMVLGLICAVFLFVLSVCRRVRRGDRAGNPDDLQQLTVLCALFSMIAFAVWASMQRQQYNTSNRFAEVGQYASSPDLHYGVCFGLAICIFLISLLFLFVRIKLPSFRRRPEPSRSGQTRGIQGGQFLGTSAGANMVVDDEQNGVDGGYVYQDIFIDRTDTDGVAETSMSDKPIVQHPPPPSSQTASSAGGGGAGAAFSRESSASSTASSPPAAAAAAANSSSASAAPTASEDAPPTYLEILGEDSKA